MKAFAVVAALLAGTSFGQGFVRSHVKNRPDRPLFWKDRCFAFQIGEGGSARTPGRSEDLAIEKAFATWQREAQRCGNTWQFVRGDDVPVSRYRLGPERSGRAKAVVLFRQTNCREVVPVDDACAADPDTAHTTCANKYQCLWAGDEVIGITTTSYRPSTGEIIDTDIELNETPLLNDDGSLGPARLFTTVDSPPCRSFAASAPTCIAFDVQAVVTHEIGHALGLDHVEDDTSSTMFPSADLGELGKRTLDPGTARGFCTIYPPGSDGPECTSTIVRSLDAEVPIEGATGCAQGLGGAWVLAALLGPWRRRARR